MDGRSGRISRWIGWGEGKEAKKDRVRETGRGEARADETFQKAEDIRQIQRSLLLRH